MYKRQELVNEQLKIYGVEVTYIPRKIVNRDTIFTEVESSKFDDSYTLEAYVNTYEGYGGQGDIMTKFGVSLKDELTLTISKERFEDFIVPFLQTEDDSQVIVVDVVGVLSHLYWDGIIAYVGGGFSIGIHNIMEPAIARLPILFGPRYKNFHEAEELINSGGGWAIDNGQELFDKINMLLSDNSKIIPASLAATDVIHKNIGAATRVVRGIIRD